MKPFRKKLVIVNQDVGYLFIDLANAALGHYDQVVLISGSIVELGSGLDDRVETQSMIRYRRHSVVSRFFSWILGTLHVAWLLSTRYRRHDVLAASNPPLNSLLPLIIRNRIGLYVLDLYPEALYQTGMLAKKSPVVRSWSRLNKWAYRRLDTIWALTPSMRSMIERHYGVEVGFAPAWASQMQDKPDRTVVEKLGLAGRWVVLYSGNLGREHDVEVLLECASKLRAHDQILFVIAGEGWKKKVLAERADLEALANVMLLPKMPSGEFASLLSEAKVGVVTQSLRTADVCIPSKTFNLLSVGVPILGIGNPDSDFGDLINTSGSGRVFKPDQVDEICQFILSCWDDEEFLHGLQCRARLSAGSFTSKNAMRLVEEFVGEVSNA